MRQLADGKAKHCCSRFRESLATEVAQQRLKNGRAVFPEIPARSGKLEDLSLGVPSPRRGAIARALKTAIERTGLGTELRTARKKPE